MRPLASFCRQQEALHRSRAASEPLANRRSIALAAAQAWSAEALLADKRGSQTRSAGDEAIAADLALEDDEPEAARVGVGPAESW